MTNRRPTPPPPPPPRGNGQGDLEKMLVIAHESAAELRQTLEMLQLRIAKLERENAELRRDAERWRECERLVDVNWCGDWVLIDLDGDTFAAAIDAAIQKRKEGI